jgi:Na+-driven multidrug efflux pump
LFLPLIFGMEGIWWAVVVAECLSAILSIVLLLTHRSRYGYHFLNLSK